MSIHVTNIGFTKVGDHWGRSLAELGFEASKNAIREAPIQPDTVVIANAFSELTSSQAQLGPVIADALGLEGAESFKVESGGASGAAALHIGSNLIQSGQSKSVLVLGVEKMRDLDPTKLVLVQSLSEQSEYSQFFGVSFASMNALLARLYMKHFNIDRERLSAFPVVAHRNSSTVEHAQFKKKFTVEEVSRSEIISDPLRVLDCAPIGDGAACCIMTNGESLSDEQRKSSVEIVASESASGRVNFFERDDMFHFLSAETATKKALKKARIGLDSLSFFEIHDSYSITTALAVEAIGLSRRGHACIDAANGKFDLNGKHPISTFGGMKARGYPVGASGIYQMCEAFLQLKEKAGFNQVPHASKGLLHSMSGIDGSAYVHIVTAGKGTGA